MNKQIIRERGMAYLTRFGAASIVFFAVKGMLWILVPVLITRFF